MTATNHVATGALIATVIKQPYLALPLAFLSHFVLDMIPHFGIGKGHINKTFATYLTIDMSCASAVLLAVLIIHPANWLLIMVCAVLAASPDLLWLYYLIFEFQGKPKAFGPVAKLLADIQWSETISGLLVELAWLTTTGYLLINRI
jgi:hypothetical protein